MASQVVSKRRYGLLSRMRLQAFFEENKGTSTRHFIHSTFNDPDWQIPNKSILNIIKLLKQRRL
jgi:hypothetical protein